MTKRLAWMLAIGLTMGVACSPKSASAPTTASTEIAAPTATPQPIPSAEAGPSNPTAAPASTPTREQVVQVQPGDWVRGPADAAVTIIEWGDFQ